MTMLELSPTPAVTLMSMDPDTKARRVEHKQSRIVRREVLLEEARRLKNRARFGRWKGAPTPGASETFFVMRPETLDFIVQGQTALHEVRDLSVGETPMLYDVPVLFSDEIEQDRIILAFEGWPYFGKKDQQDWQADERDSLID
jgi:hypothetical protein